MKVALVVDVVNLQDKQLFEEHLYKEGFSTVENESFAYVGEATSHIFNTRAYILEVVSKGLEKILFDTCRIIFEIGDNPMEIYNFDHNTNGFIAINS